MKEVASHQKQEANNEAQQACCAALAHKAGAGSETMAKRGPDNHQGH